MNIEGNLNSNLFNLDYKISIIYFRVRIEGDNEPEPSVPREEGNIPFIFVGTKVTSFLKLQNSLF